MMRHWTPKLGLPAPIALALSLMIGLMAGCAVPVPPTGGPPDSTPPALESSIPTAGSTGISTDELVFTFSEPVDENSFRTAFSIVPDLDGPVEIKRSGRTVRVRLPGSLRAETTYRVTLDGALRDLRSVNLESPITLAFATGDTIDRAALKGHVLGAFDGSPQRGVDVWAFAEGDTDSLAAALEVGPLYRTQTGNDGRFDLTYVRPGAYTIVAVLDGNRNRSIDPGERVAVPPEWSIMADTLGKVVAEPWVLAQRDEEAPMLDRIRAVSDRELELRFSEALDLWLDEPLLLDAPLVLTDSTGARLPVSRVWPTSDRARVLMAEVEDLSPGGWTLEGSLSVVDSAGNRVQALESSVSIPEGLPSPDPVSFLGWLPDSLSSGTNNVRTVWPVEDPGFRLDRPSEEVQVQLTDTLGIVLIESLSPTDATLYQWNTAVPGSDPYRVSIQVPGEDSTRSLTLRSASDRDTGALGVEIISSRSPVKGELFATDNPFRAVQQQTFSRSPLLFEGLPRGFRGQTRVFVDRDGDGRWSPGSLIPYAPAEPVRWISFEEGVRPRWETVASDTLRFDVPTFVQKLD